MIKILKPEDCCGCTACASICPQQCIAMKADEEGFAYPHVNAEKCVECGLCEKVCPVKNREQTPESLLESYVLRNNCDDVLMNSPSGGAFSAMAQILLEENAAVYGAVFDTDWTVRHLRTEDASMLGRFRGSKYVQSDMTGIYPQVKSDLRRGGTVLFSGTPCQVDGLMRYLGKDYPKLYTVDVICHGVPSPKLWRLYRGYQEQRFGSDLAEANFRNKTYGYHSGSMRLRFENGREYYGSARVDYMLKAFFKEIASRPSCYDCPVKKLEHRADLSLYDCWNADKLLGYPCDDRGYTNVLAHTEKGRELLERMRPLCFVQKVDTEQAVALDGVMIQKSAVPNKNRGLFYQSLDADGLKKTVDRFIPVTGKDQAVEKSKRILYRLGVINAIRRMRDKMKGQRK